MIQLPLLAAALALSAPHQTVKVLGADGAPLAEALVVVRALDPLLPADEMEVEWATTDTAGRVWLPGVPHGLPLEIVVRHDLYPDFALESPAAPASPFEVRMPEPPWALVDVHGWLASASGEPVAGVEVVVRPALWATTSGRATTGPDGGFVVRGLMEGAYRVEVEEGEEPSLVRGVAVLREMPPLDLRLPPATRIQGRILAADEAGGGRWEVQAESRLTDPPGYRRDSDPCDNLISTYCGPDGVGQSVEGTVDGSSYEIFLPPGEWRIFAGRDGGKSGEVWEATAEIWVEAGERQRWLDLSAAWVCSRTDEAGGRLEGRVFEEGTGRPVAGALVRTPCGTASSREDGTFELEDHCARGGEYGPLHVEPPPPWADLFLEVLTAEAGPVELGLERASPLCYEVLWADGEPFRGRVALFAAGRDRQLAYSFPDARGRGCLEGVAAGAHEIAFAGLSAAWRVRRLPVWAPSDEIRVTLPLAGSLEIRAPELATRYGQGWLDGVTVRLDPLVGPAGSLLLQPDDELLLEEVPPGLWSITVEAPGGRSWRAVAEVSARRDTVVVVR